MCSRLANLFISPIFPKDSVVREVSNIDSEFQRRSHTLFIVLETMSQEICDPSHSYHFGLGGNRESLLFSAQKRNSSLEIEARHFFESSYSSNIMVATVVGRQTLDELTAIVVPLFSAIPNRQFKMKTWTSSYGEQHLGRIITFLCFVPVRFLLKKSFSKTS